MSQKPDTTLVKKSKTISITPNKHLRLLSHSEVRNLCLASQSTGAELLRRCALAILSSGIESNINDLILEQYRDFEIDIIQEEKGLRLLLHNPPKQAFVDGKLITGIKEHLFSVVRDIAFIEHELLQNKQSRLSLPVSDLVFSILRNAELLQPDTQSKLVICWGGHSISRDEYDYTKEVGYQLGLRDLEIGTGCGPGAMKGPMKGATIGHAKQHIQNGRYIGISEPGIIAAEPPNPIVNHLVILPDIEKRLEAFLRLGHGFIVFPGGVGTLEEILFVLGILYHPKNKEIPFPLIFTANQSSANYFKMIQSFLTTVFGEKVHQKFEIIIDKPDKVARQIKKGIQEVRGFRKQHKDAYYFNWKLHIEPELQKPFVANHRNMAQLKLSHDQAPHELAANLRKAFSGIVAGNVKPEGVAAVLKKGPFKLKGSSDILNALDEILSDFVSQNRMSLSSKNYTPCYKLISNNEN